MMNPFNEEQILESRLNDYQQSVLSVMGISQWQLRGILADEASSGVLDDANDVANANETSIPTDADSQEKKVASIGALREVLSLESSSSGKEQSIENQSSELIKKEPAGLNPIFPIESTEKPFVDSVVLTFAEGAKVSIDWSIANEFSLSGDKLETPPIAYIMNNPIAKKQLWNLLITVL
jgi:DNA polymerase III psi subunit